MFYLIGAATLGTLAVVGTLSYIAIKSTARASDLENALEELSDHYDELEAKLNYFCDINSQLSLELGLQPEEPDSVEVYH